MRLVWVGLIGVGFAAIVGLFGGPLFKIKECRPETTPESVAGGVLHANLA